MNIDKMDQEAREMKQKLDLNEQLYFSHVVKGYAEKLLWPEISKLMKVRSPPVPFSTVAEILYEVGNKELSADMFVKVSDKEQRIELLLDY